MTTIKGDPAYRCDGTSCRIALWLLRQKIRMELFK